MKIIRYSDEDNKPQYGCVEDNKIYSVERFRKSFRKKRLAGHLDKSKLLAPCNPKKVVAVAKNFKGLNEDKISNHKKFYFLLMSANSRANM